LKMSSKVACSAFSKMDHLRSTASAMARHHAAVVPVFTIGIPSASSGVASIRASKSDLMGPIIRIWRGSKLNETENSIFRKRACNQMRADWQRFPAQSRSRYGLEASATAYPRRASKADHFRVNTSVTSQQRFRTRRTGT
jgi:hypothetical protein